MASAEYGIFPSTMATGATLTSAMDIGSPWAYVYLHVPAITSGTNIWIKAAPTLAGTYNRVTQPSINSTAAQTNSFTVASVQTSAVVPLPNGLRFVKIETATLQSDTSLTFYITGSK